MNKYPILELDKFITESKEKLSNTKIKNPTVLSVTNDKGFVTSENITSKDLGNYKIIKKNYFAYNPSRINVGSLGFAGDIEEGVVSPAYTVFKCNDDLNPEYLYRFLKSDLGKYLIKLGTRGSVRDSLNIDKLKKIKISYPDVNAQNELISQINKIENNKNLLDKKINELRNKLYLASRTFVSKDYQLRSKLLDNFDFQKGSFSTQKTSGKRFPFITTSGEERYADSFDIQGPAVCIPLTSATGHGHASINRIFYLNDKFALANIIGALTPKKSSKIETKYLYYYLFLMKDEVIVPLMRGTSNVSLNEKRLSKISIIHPDKEDQIKIIKFIDKIVEIENMLIVEKRKIEPLIKSIVSTNMYFALDKNI